MHSLRSCIVGLAFVLAAGLWTAPADHCAPSMPSAKAKHVVLISVDGLAASYLEDARADLPTLRMLARRGAAARGMITAFPSVTWPAHVTLVTGVHPRTHGVIGNAVFDRRKGRLLTYIGDPELTKDEAVRAPTLYDVAHAAGMKCGSVIWPCSNGSKTLDWVIPDSNKAELHARYTTPGFRETLAEAGIDIAPLGKWGWDKKYSTPRDELYSKVARYLLDKHRPNLLLVHYITPDGVEHAYGPHTPEAYQAVAESDRRVREVWDALQKPPLAGKATLFVVSDHGFAHYEKVIQPNVVLKQLGLIETDERNKPTQRRAWCVSQGGSAFIYVLDEDAKQELLSKVRTALGKIEGVQSVLAPEQFVKLGLPHPRDNPEMAQLVLTTGPGYSFSDGLTGKEVISAGGYKGTHGHVPQPAYMHATFVAAGAGIKPGVKLKTVQSIDVAPTIARLLGLKFERAEGRVLTEILED
jgi:predicted AlkP superfamily pyrophosphatase or phosphodiesterase